VGLYAGSNNNNSSGGRNLNVGIKHGGTEYWSGSIDFSINGWRTHSDPVPRVHKYTTYVDPGDSGALTASDLDSLQVGVRTNSSATTLIRISTAWVLVEYVPAGGTNVTAEPSALSLSSSQPSVTVSAIRNATITPSALSLVASQPTPTISAVQNVSVSAGVQALTSSIPSPTVTEGLGDSISPSAQDLTASLPSATVTTIENVLIEPAVQALTATQIDPNVSAIQNVTVSPSVQTLAISQASPTVVEGVGVSNSASEQDLTLSQLSLTVSTTQNVSETASVQALTVSQAAPTVTAVQNITVSPSVQAITASLPTPVISASGANTYSLDLEKDSSESAYINDGDQTGLDLTGDFTIEVSLDIESVPSTSEARAIVNKNDTTGNQRGYQFLYRDNGGTKQILVALSADGTTANRCARAWNVDLGTATWAHVAVTCDISNSNATKFILYVNGVSQGNGSDIGTDAGTVNAIFNNTAAFQVGNEVTNPKPYDGLIDELRVFNVVRTESEINTNKAQHIDPGTTGLVGYWRFNGDLLDETDNDNDLTFSSGSPTYSTDVPFGGATNSAYDAGVQSVVFSQPSPTISTVRNTTISPSVQALTTTQPSPTITAEQNISISPSVQTMTASLGEPVVGGITLTTPDVQSLSISLPSPTISTVQNVTISPDVQSLVAVQPTPTITAEESVIISLAAQVLTSSLASPSVDAIRNVSTTLNALVMSVLQPELAVEIPAAWVNQPKIDESDNWTPRSKTESDNWTPHAKIASGGWNQRSKTEADGWNPRSKIDGSGSWNSKTKISN
jgi:SOS-response transcriptional repressor LexA